LLRIWKNRGSNPEAKAGRSDGRYSHFFFSILRKMGW